jgi:hypothetical protein
LGERDAVVGVDGIAAVAVLDDVPFVALGEMELVCFCNGESFWAWMWDFEI